jgi:ABC-type transport system involved in cytochrome c biogenesis permease subunit
MKKSLPFLILAGAVAIVAATWLPPRQTTAFDLVAFGRLPVLVNGRLKPLDTVARASLLQLQGRQRVVTAEGRALAPTAWLLDMLYRPGTANAYPVFEIVHPDLLTLVGLSPEDGSGGKRFAAGQLARSLRELDRQAGLAESTENAIRTPFQRAVLHLRDNVVTYQHLQCSVVPPGVDDYLDQFSNFERALSGAKTAGDGPTGHDSAANKLLLEMGSSFAAIDTYASLLLVPSETQPNRLLSWKNTGASLQESLSTGRINPAVKSLVAIGLAWRAQDPDAFNTAVHSYGAALGKSLAAELRKTDWETRFNSAQPFYTSLDLYVASFLFAVFSWLIWPNTLSRAAFWLTALAFTVSTIGIATRMWLEGRPPVTNLYSSALFVGWGAVGLCLGLELVFKNAIGSVAAGLIGFATLVIAHHLSLSGDTLEMMRAVLDSNFWLATHVVVITLGYAATFLAGFLALIYVLRGVLTRTLDAATADALNRMVYGILCFATLFSFVGTVLGGIWADQSWGRFWGWDPKENGALIIVLWNALILHARWGGLIKQRGLMALAIAGNIVTSWSWFGVNMLGVGLHSYGFMDAAFWWLVGFVATQLVVIALVGIPPEKWRSSGASMSVAAKNLPSKKRILASGMANAK